MATAPAAGPGERIAIVDVTMDRLGESLAAPAGRCLIRFWVGDWPVGAVYDDGPAGRPLAPADLAARAVEADSLAAAEAGVARNLPAPREGDVSVVICTRDRPDALARCLASLPQQTLRPMQVIVVDNASVDDRTRQAALAAGVDYIREDRPGLDIARNTGARAARGAIVAYTDDDVSLHPRWLERLVAAFDGDRIAAVTGLVLPGELESEAQIMFERYWSFGKGFRRIDFDAAFYAADRHDGCPAWDIGAGASMAFRRETFDQVGWFDERLDVGAAGCSGDSEYWHRILSHGLVCRYEPGAVAYHFHRREMAGLSGQIFHYLRGHAAALLVQYERSGNRGNLRRAFLILPAFFARRVARHMLRRRKRPEDRFLAQEIGGFLSGLKYYAIARIRRRAA